MPQPVAGVGRPPSTTGVEIARFEKADRLYVGDDWAGAEQAYAELVKTFPRNAFAWFRWGNCQSRLGQWESAAQSFSNARSIEPRDGRFSYNLGLVRLAQARAAFESTQAQPDAQPPLRLAAREQVERLVRGPSDGVAGGR